MPHLKLCQITLSNTRDCQRAVPADFPTDVCEMHALMITAVMLERGGAAVRRLRSMYTPGYVRRLDTDEQPKPPMFVDDAPVVVYYVRHGDQVKIGTTHSLVNRLRQIRHDALLAIEPGHYDLEKLRHWQFAENRLDGEWFALDADLEDHIAHIVEMYGEPHQAYTAWSAKAA